MTTVDDIRRERLATLISEAGGVAKLANKLGKSSAQISQWLNASPDSKTGRPRGMRPDSCREIESACGKQTGWMDAAPELSHLKSENDAGVVVFRSSVKISERTQALINEIIAAEETGTSSRQLIYALTQVLHVAIRPTPAASESDYPGIRCEIERRKHKP